MRCAVRVFERYSMMGGKKTVLFKINTPGEDAVPDCLRKIVTKHSR